MEKFKRSLTLRGWFRLMAVVLVAVLLLAVSRLMWIEWRQLERADEGQHAVLKLRLALVAAEMVSRERGPANGVMGDPSGADPDLRQALVAARQRTDEAYQRFADVFHGEVDDPRFQRALQQSQAYRRALTQARTTVDELAGRPMHQRQSEDIRQAVRGMVALVPMLSPALTLLAEEAQLADPRLASTVWASRLAAELREYAGLLGSLFTPALAREEPFSEAELADIEHVRGRIDQLRHLLQLRVGLSHDGDPLVKAHARVEQEYFGRAAALLRTILLAGQSDGQFGMTPAEFAAQYVPQMESIIALRDAMLDMAALRSAESHRRSVDTLLLVGGLTTGVLALVLSMLKVTHQRFVAPLSESARVLHAMSAGDLSHELPRLQAQDEVAEVIKAIATLRQQSQARAELERERDKLIETLREQSTTDHLTGLANRRAFFDAAEAELARARRHGFPLVLMLLDVDHFKKVNDTVGHAGGDAALCTVATLLRQTTRQGDLSARLGGEEFVALLSHSSLEDGHRFAERVRLAIEAQAIDLPHGHGPLHVTVSIGLADSSTHGLTLETLLARADDAMYRAKRAGRNRTEHAKAA